jgi:hypothetical protein
MVTANVSRLLIPLLLEGCRGAPQSQEGLRFPPYPTGVTSVSGSLLQDTLGGTDYVIDWVTTAPNPQLWFGRFDGRDAAGRPFWRLVDTLSVPAYDTTRTLVIAQCTLRGQFDAELIALVAYEMAESLHTVFSAWRADRRQGRFLAVPPTGIACANEGYGAE